MKSIKNIFHSASNSVEKSFPKAPPVIKGGMVFLALSAATATCLHLIVKELAKELGFSLEDAIREGLPNLKTSITPPETLVKEASGAEACGTDTSTTLEKTRERSMLSISLQHTYHPF